MTEGTAHRQPAADGPVITPTHFQPPSGLNQLPRFRFPWIKSILGILVLIGVWATWYVTSANSVEIITEPTDALVEIDELVAPRIGNKWILRPGPRRVIATASGYQTFRNDIEITDEALQSHAIVLVPLPGHLRVGISPPISAELHIDEEPAVSAPTVVRDLSAGPHQVLITAPRYKKFEQVIDIQGRDIEQALDVTLQPAWTDASFDSAPQGATVSVDGESVGTTPLAIELLEGARDVQFELIGFKPWKRTLEVQAGVALTLPQVILKKADGMVTVTTAPRGATITVDGEYRGSSPQQIAISPDESHTVKAIKPGYTPTSTTVRAKSGETKSITLQLVAELAPVRFTVIPEDAELLIDGELQSSSNQTLKLPTHEHAILIRKDGFTSYESNITPRKGVEKRVRVRLREGSNSISSSATPAATTGTRGRANADSDSITTAIGQQLKLFRGGDVTLGSSRRDPARRANEGIRQVSLRRPFYLGIKEVTNGELRQFLANHDSKSSNGHKLNEDKQPAAHISWNTAALFCNWLSRKDSLPVFYQIKAGQVLGINPAALGYRLPTEAEWALAARMSSNNQSYNYPWAGTYPPRGRVGNFADQSARQIFSQVIADYNDGFAVSAPVGSFPPNLNGLYDMGGNVAEWVHDYYAAAPVGTGVLIDPLGPRTGQQHIISGASWAHSGDTELRLAYRDHGTEPRYDVGFRIARYAQ